MLPLEDAIRFRPANPETQRCELTGSKAVQPRLPYEPLSFEQLQPNGQGANLRLCDGPDDRVTVTTNACACAPRNGSKVIIHLGLRPSHGKSWHEGGSRDVCPCYARRMIFTILAPPSQFSVWAVPAIRILIEHHIGDLDYLVLTTIDQFKTDWQKRKSQHAILFSDCPDAQLSGVLCRNEGPTIFLREHPAIVAKHCEDFSLQSPISAARLASISFASMHDIVLKCPGARIFSNDKSPETTLRNIANFCSIAVSDDEINSILARVPITKAPRKAEVETSSFDVSEDVAQSLAPYASISAGVEPEIFSWPRSLFSRADKFGAPTDAMLEKDIDLLGPARVLFYGPYYHLPRGHWELSVELTVKDNFSGNRISAEITAGLDLLAKSTAPLPPEGRYEFKMRFSVSEPRDALQLRVSITEGAIEGRILVDAVTISKLKSPG